VKKAVLTSLAESDITRAVEWYAGESPALAFDFLRCVEATLAGIGRAPGVFRARADGWRKAMLPRFPYAVFFRWTETDDRPVVIRVLPMARDSGPLLRK
jgi:plasmid stabilization system protein ParE